jgi:hypothetical protein
METTIYNIDSKDRNTESFPNSHLFTYNKVDTSIDGVIRIEPFNKKNVIEINIDSIQIPNTFYFINNIKGNNMITIGGTDYTIPNGSYTKDELMTVLTTIAGITLATYSSTTSKVTLTTSTFFIFTAINDYQSLGEILGYENNISYTSNTIATNALTLPQESYVFLNINDFGNIIHKEQRYVAKLIPNNTSRFDDINQETVYKTLSTRIIFDQPKDIKELKISLRDNTGNLASINNVNFSFNLEVKTISNSILKQYKEMKFYNHETMDRILSARMLEYYNKQVDNKNHTLTQNYSNNMQHNYNNIELQPFGNRNNYNYSEIIRS